MTPASSPERYPVSRQLLLEELEPLRRTLSIPGEVLILVALECLLVHQDEAAAHLFSVEADHDALPARSSLCNFAGKNGKLASRLR